MPFVTEEIWAYLPDRERAAARRRAFPAPTRTLLDPGAEREIERRDRPRPQVRRWRDLVGVPAGSVLAGAGRRRSAARARRQARPARVRGLRRRARWRRSARSRSSPPRRSTPARPERGSRPSASGCGPRSSALERKLANQGFVDKAPPRWSRTSARSSTGYRARAGRAGLAPLAWSAASRPRPTSPRSSRSGCASGSSESAGWSRVLGMPQHRFASIHVVGTNGKSAVTEMTAALLEAHGTRGRRLPLACMTSAGRSGSGSAARRSRRAPSGPRSSASPRPSRRSTAASTRASR